MIPTISISEKISLSRAIDSDIEIPVPHGLGYLGFQKAAVDYSRYCSNILLADEPGLGKTIQAIGILNLKGFKKIAVFAPSSLIRNWVREIGKWSMTPNTFEIYHPKTYRGDSDILIVAHYWLSFKDTLKDLHKRGRNDAHIFDEVHVLKNGSAAITKFVFAPNGVFSLSENNICASGTPLENKPIELFYLIKSLAPDALGNLNRFSYGMKYCGGFKSEWGWDFNGASNLSDLGRRLRSSVMVRRTKKQVLKELPEKVINLAYLDYSKTPKTLLKKLALYEDVVIKGTVSVDVTEISTVRKELGVAKIAQSVEFIKTQLNGGREKIVVFAHHKEVIDGLMLGLSDYNPLEISGGVSEEKRDEAVQLFQNSPQFRVIVVSIRAGGVGLTLTAASYMCMVEIDWVPGRLSQAMDRCHRIGQRESVQVDLLVYEGTLDERMIKVVMKKESNMRELYQDEEGEK